VTDSLLNNKSYLQRGNTNLQSNAGNIFIEQVSTAISNCRGKGVLNFQKIHPELDTVIDQNWISLFQD
jgi:hypothetical protein